MLVSDHYGRPYRAELVKEARNGDSFDQTWAEVAVRVALAGRQHLAYLRNGMVVSVEGA